MTLNKKKTLCFFWFGLLCFMSQSLFANDTTPDYSFIQSASGSKVTLFSAKWCGYCKKTREFLESKNIQFTDLDVEESVLGQQLFQKINAFGVPVIIIGSTRIDGFNPKGMLTALMGTPY